MQVRYKNSPDGKPCYSSEFNVCAFAEVLVFGDDGGGDSAFIADLDVLIGPVWVDMRKAFMDRLIVPNNHNTHFGFPENEICRERGYNN
jgi:hypothetical protein